MNIQPFGQYRVDKFIQRDDYDKELAELKRVTKSGGWILDCPGEDDCKGIPDQEMLKRGFEYFYYVGKTGGDIYRYRKQVIK